MNSFNNITELNTPWDTLIDCIMIKTNHPNASYYACIISTIYGTLIGYIFPMIGIFSLITNSIVAMIFFSLIHQKNLYFIFLGILAITDIGFDILIDLLITRQLFLTCWFTNYTLFLSIYQVLFSNSCLFQLTFVSFIDLLFLIKIIKWSKQRYQLTIHNCIVTKLKTKQISKIITLIVLDLISFISSIPSSILYIILVSKTQPNLEEIRIFTLLIHMSWGLIILQSSLNIILYYKRIDYFRNNLMKLINCH
ncbi:unnamed protein product [Schistosoma mattheei]|uniref:Uncharacterized protein n=1 Tax=Schistosoma mattheei TaxID=31246 RepID=A0A183Q6L6_9TREM|nr:unnamed protein product [Schistosoma mattheei]